MNTRTRITLAIVLLTLAPVGLAAQETTMYSANPLRLDLRVLGHPPLDVIPPGESAITSLVVGADGNLYGGTSGRTAHLFVLDPRWGHVFPLGHLPGQESIFHALAAAPDGSIYIGTSDGFIFRFDPETMTIQNLGKPVWQQRIRGLAFSQDGDLWGVGGEPGGSARVFVYRTRAGSFESGGMLHVNRTPYYAWLAYEAESMIAGPDGTLFIGETGRLAHLYLLYPWK